MCSSDLGLAKDYPDLWLKPIGTQYPPWIGPFGAEQNRLGPWPPIIAWRQRNIPPDKSGSVAANDLEFSVHTTIAR